MDVFFELFKSDFGVAISWVCTVGGFAFGLFKRRENARLKLEVAQLKFTINNLGNDSVSQSGTGNLYTKQNSGGMNIRM